MSRKYVVNILSSVYMLGNEDKLAVERETSEILVPLPSYIMNCEKTRHFQRYLTNPTLWKERNSRCFEDRFDSIQKVKWNGIVYFYFWCTENNLEDVEQLVDLLGSP
ncbi:hypothetical protein H5410_042426 [Solanum commersonii]|uniref:Uncharacterized protein n=1 Tax=Solanum commersonii TaxID=4109 RepID=A0A9J5XXH1_SOLCO|nr:hypothetical protein H5410_042426 [Solanum commersonii]